MVTSRAFQIDLSEALITLGGGLQRVLLPVIDLFNHHQDAVSTIWYESLNDTICLRTRSTWSTGDEVHINYGNLSDATLRLQFGIGLKE